MKKDERYGLISILLSVIIILLCIFGYTLNLYKESIIADKSNSRGQGISAKYRLYLSNLEGNIKERYEEFSNNVISGNSKELNTNYTFTITKDLELIFNTENKTYDNYKVSDNVVNMFLVNSGNGGFKYLYFIKLDGSLNVIHVDKPNEDGTLKIENKPLNYIVNVTQGLFDYEVSGAYDPIFIDIEGNMYK